MKVKKGKPTKKRVSHGEPIHFILHRKLAGPLPSFVLKNSCPSAVVHFHSPILCSLNAVIGTSLAGRNKTPHQAVRSTDSENKRFDIIRQLAAITMGTASLPAIIQLYTPSSDLVHIMNYARGHTTTIHFIAY